MDDFEDKVLAELIITHPQTTKDLASRMREAPSRVHKAMVQLRRARKVQFIGKRHGWVPA